MLENISCSLHEDAEASLVVPSSTEAVCCAGTLHGPVFIAMRIRSMMIPSIRDVDVDLKSYPEFTAPLWLLKWLLAVSRSDSNHLPV